MAKIKDFLVDNRGRFALSMLGSSMLLAVMAITMKFWIFGVGAVGAFIIYTFADPKCKSGFIEEDIIKRYRDKLPGNLENKEEE